MKGSIYYYLKKYITFSLLLSETHERKVLEDLQYEIS